MAVPKTDAVQAILTSAGVEYTHDNSEVVGSSRVEEQLSQRAAMTSYTAGDVEGQSALFADANDEQTPYRVHRPPEDVSAAVLRDGADVWLRQRNHVRSCRGELVAGGEAELPGYVLQDARGGFGQCGPG